jgi:hypothetical protein
VCVCVCCVCPNQQRSRVVDKGYKPLALTCQITHAVEILSSVSHPLILLPFMHPCKLCCDLMLCWKEKKVFVKSDDDSEECMKGFEGYTM